MIQERLQRPSDEYYDKNKRNKENRKVRRDNSKNYINENSSGSRVSSSCNSIWLS